MKEAVTKVIDTLTQEEFHGAFQRFLERYKWIAAGGDYFEGDKSFMCVLSIKVHIRKKSGNFFNEQCIYICMYVYIYVDIYKKAYAKKILRKSRQYIPLYIIISFLTYHIYPTPLLGQDVAQGQFLSEV